MLFEIFYIAIMLLVLFFFLSLFFYTNEWKAKMQYPDFIKDANDGIKNNFASNNEYGLTYTKGIAFTEDENGKIVVKSQSKLAGYSTKF